ncbi:hypothetical protein [Paenibacillus sp. TH7-28]
MAEYVPTVVTECLRIVVCTRNRNWDNDQYRNGVIEPYNRIQEMQNQLEKSGLEPSIDQMRSALEMLKTVFETKMVPIEEQRERFEEVFTKTNTHNLFADFEIPQSV